MQVGKIYARLGSTLVLATLMHNNVYAVDAVSATVGEWTHEQSVIGRLGLLWVREKPLWSAHTAALNIALETSVAYTHQNAPHSLQHNENRRSLWILAATPVFKLMLPSRHTDTTVPYLEGAIGASFLSSTRLGHKKLGVSFQFEDRIGLGLQFQPPHGHIWQLAARYFHYSHTSLINNRNSGLDYATIGVNYFL